MNKNPLLALVDEGVSVWLDYLSRDLMESGHLQKLIDADGLRGETSNPTIFQKALSQGQKYDTQVRDLASKGQSAEEICWEVMVQDVRGACDIFRPVFEATGGLDGYVSLELDPRLATDTDKALAQGKELWKRVDRPNLMLKVPGTQEGLPVIEELLFEGMNINVTLLFSADRYQQVMEAFFRGLERRVDKNLPIDTIASVASFFVSRVDTEADKRLDKIKAAKPELAAKVDGLKGRIAVANARLAYGRYLELFGTERWKKLQAKGARVQRPLWASTGTKNPAYRDIIYVADLIGPDCVNTMPEETMDAFRDHGVVARTLTHETIAEARQVLEDMAALGVDLDDVTDLLVRDGVQKFIDSFVDLMGTVAKEREKALSRA